MFDSISNNLGYIHGSAGRVSSTVRPRLAAAPTEPAAIPVDVHVRLIGNETPIPTGAVPLLKPTSASRPVGTLLDCYM